MVHLFRRPLVRFLVLFYVLLVIWWVGINLTGKTNTNQSYVFGGSYALIALIGGIAGLLFSRRWGGWKSMIGRAVIFLSLGLLGEAFGQLTWTFYNVVLQVEVPYPSVADIGYFSIIPFYALAMINIGMASGVRFSLGTYFNKFQVIAIPLVMLIFSYVLFLRNYEFDFTKPLLMFLDFGYPMGEAITISLAILTFTLTRDYLGGLMRSRILYIVFAFVVQYVTDYTFLYRASREIYVNGGLVDLMYVTSFVIMSVGLVAISKLELGAGPRVNGSGEVDTAYQRVE